MLIFDMLCRLILLSVRVTVGPLARDMGGLILLSQALFTPRMHSLDPFVPPLSFRDEVSLSVGKLRKEYRFLFVLSWRFAVDGMLKSKN